MSQQTVLHIGFDDTDSPKGMCTTYLAYKIVNTLRKENVKFLDYPRLIRFNPNIPWKTRGNGAVGLSIKTSEPDKIKQKVKHMVKSYSDTKNGANPGLVFYQNNTIPKDFASFSELALWKLISRSFAKQFVSKNNLESFYLGNGQGLVGAVGAIGYHFSDRTFELLSYRKKKQFGKKRQIIPQSVRLMQEKTHPYTFNSYDKKTKRVLITPRGPDPVFYGVRGEDPKTVVNAAKLIQTNENLDGYLVFKTNQGTNDHLKNELHTFELKPYSSGIVSGIVSSKPKIENGGHVFFSLTTNDYKINCAVYRPTKITSIALELAVGDKIRVGGGIRKASKKHNRTLNVEFIEILQLEKQYKMTNPSCIDCNKKTKSKGNSQGFECIKCKSKADKKIRTEIPRKITQKLYVPAVTAHRHLTRPLQRIGRTNHDTRINKSVPWFHVFTN
ncbi:MAG: TiaS agmantine-binding domain-containing protein [Nitrososphaerota archaeon]